MASRRSGATLRLSHGRDGFPDRLVLQNIFVQPRVLDGGDMHEQVLNAMKARAGDARLDEYLVWRRLEATNLQSRVGLSDDRILLFLGLTPPK